MGGTCRHSLTGGRRRARRTSQHLTCRQPSPASPRTLQGPRKRAPHAAPRARVAPALCAPGAAWRGGRPQALGLQLVQGAGKEELHSTTGAGPCRPTGGARAGGWGWVRGRGFEGGAELKLPGRASAWASRGARDAGEGCLPTAFAAVASWAGPGGLTAPPCPPRFEELRRWSVRPPAGHGTHAQGAEVRCAPESFHRALLLPQPAFPTHPGACRGGDTERVALRAACRPALCAASALPAVQARDSTSGPRPS